MNQTAAKERQKKSPMQVNCNHKQPNTTHCFVCGTENQSGLGLNFYDDGDLTVQSKFVVREEFQGYPGIVHGGILATILDEVVGRVAMIEDHHRFMMTVNMKVQFRNPVPIGEELTAQGKIIKLKGRLAKAHGQILLPDARIGCEAELTLADMPAEMASESTLRQLGWRVVPDE